MRNETTQANEMRRLADALRKDMRVLQIHGETIRVTTHSDQTYHKVLNHTETTGQVFTLHTGWDYQANVARTEAQWIASGTRVLGCACEWWKRHGDHVTWTNGQTNHVSRCVHVLVAVWYTTPIWKRERLAAQYPALLPFVADLVVAA